MIHNTFQHISGIGPATERLLWQRGIHTWEALENKLRAGLRPADVLRDKSPTIPRLFDFETGVATEKSQRWLDELDQSRHALDHRDYSYFLSRLPGHEHWRILPGRESEVLYLDIETTGLSREVHHVTVIGALHHNTFYQWVWPEPLHALWELMEQVPILVTFNGSRFDVPFLAHHFRSCPEVKAHVDLVHMTRKLGIPGGQKGVEKRFGFARSKEIGEVHGALAVALWARSLYGDEGAYDTLLCYNRTDVEMLPQIAYSLCNAFAAATPLLPGAMPPRRSSCPQRYDEPPAYSSVQHIWRMRRSGLKELLLPICRRLGRTPVVVGIDLRGTRRNPTGVAVCTGPNVETQVLHADQEITCAALAANPDVVSIDAPLSLPRGRRSVSDDSECRRRGGIVRDAERILWGRHIPVYPSLIRHMQGLTRRGISIAAAIRRKGIPVVESYPGAAQDVLGIPRKGVDENLLALGLNECGFGIRRKMTHDELDAVTSALVGYAFLAGRFEALGADDEGYMILPRPDPAMAWRGGDAVDAQCKSTVCLAGLPGSGKTTLATKLADDLACRSLLLGHELRLRARKDARLGRDLSGGKLAPEDVVKDIVTDAASEARGQHLIVDGFPRHPDQVQTANRLFGKWLLVVLHVELPIAVARVSRRVTCYTCGWVGVRSRRRTCPVCNLSGLTGREEDTSEVLDSRLAEARNMLAALIPHVPKERILHWDATDAADPTSRGLAAAINAWLVGRT